MTGGDLRYLDIDLIQRVTHLIFLASLVGPHYSDIND